MPLYIAGSVMIVTAIGSSAASATLRCIARRCGVQPRYSTWLESGALFWPLVDLLWIFLFAMLYLTFFLFRDGKPLIGHLKAAAPFRPSLQDALLARFTLVVRATVKGDILVAMVQGGLAGLGFWMLGIHATILWTVLMSFLALLPLFGAALVWLPFAIYFIATGAILKGVGLLVYGVLVVGLIDNFLRPYLVGQATKMPEFVVLISTLGGIATFGLQGFITGPVVAAMFIAVWTTFLARDQL